MISDEAQQLEAVLRKLNALRTELVDLAFVLECRGRIDAADVAITTSHRVGELCEEIAPPVLAGAIRVAR